MRTLASQPTAAEGYEPLHLGSLLFAAAEWLGDEHRTNEHALPPPLFPSVRDALRALRDLREGEDPYLTFVGVLLAIEADLLKPGRATNLPPSTPLAELLGDGLPLAGDVRHLLRPASAWRAAQDRRRALPGPMTYHRRPQDHLSRLWMEWRVAKRVRVHQGDGARARALIRRTSEAWAGEHFRVALAPMSGAAGPRFEVDAKGRTFSACPTATPIEPDHLDRILARAIQEDVAILLFPELHLRERELAVVRRCLAEDGPLLAVAAGSGHVWPTEGELPHNAAPLLGAGGGLLWTHHKRGLFRVTRAQLSRPEAQARFPSLPATLAEEVVEGIQGGQALTVLDTGLGRIALAVCADLLDPEEGFLEAVRDARPAFLLLVSMSPETERFEQRAEELAQVGISTLYVNATGVDRSLSALAWLALHGTERHPPTRVRLQRGGRLEAWEPRKKWSDLDAGASVARVVEDLGLVLDLKAFCEEP